MPILSRNSLGVLVLVIWVGVATSSIVGLNRQAIGAPTAVDDAKAQAAGIRMLVGRHIVLYTDLPSKPEIDSLPAVFDKAVPEWAEYFGVDLAKTEGWQVRAFLIGDRKAFDKLGVMPTGDDKFLHGLSTGSDLWLYDQPSAYYRRHLLLHEGTHAFMGKFLGGCGPGWYMEGTAELFGTHRMDDRTSELQMRVMPRDREEVPMWGRIKLIRDAVAAGRGLDLSAVMALDNRQQMDDGSYAWCWAAAKFLDSHPHYRDRFRQLKDHVADQDFNESVKRLYGADWTDAQAEWQAFIAALDYGYDFERMAIDFRRGTALGGNARHVVIAADRGWQSSGVWLEAGKTYRVAASGRYQIAVEKNGDSEKAWSCEPGGVTIEYHDGRPLGELLGAVVGAGSNEATKTTAGSDGFAHPFTIGLGTTIKPEVSGTLYLRVNDSAAQLDDNRGSLAVTIED